MVTFVRRMPLLTLFAKVEFEPGEWNGEDAPPGWEVAQPEELGLNGMREPAVRMDTMFAGRQLTIWGYTEEAASA